VKLLGHENLQFPNPLKDDSVLVYYEKEKSCIYDEKDYFPWERKVLRKVDCEYVRKNQRKLIMDLDFFQFAELVDIKPEPGSHLIHSMSEPFSEEDIEDQVMHNWLDHFKLQFHQIHASGHMSKEQLVEMVNEISPKKAFAVHTENQELFRTYCSNIQLIEKEKHYQL
jgi:ribonuclease J